MIQPLQLLYCLMISVIVFTNTIPAISQEIPITQSSKAKANNSFASSEIYEAITFDWRPKTGPAAAYRLDSQEDQHRIIIFRNAKTSNKTPVIVGFHGQPAREKNPRDYIFGSKALEVLQNTINNKELSNVILVLPVFRFIGQNWPGFDLVDFKKKVLDILKERSIESGDWFLFGHSGAVGCGGDGLNQAHRIHPKAVGFFDTCLGNGWQQAINSLSREKVNTVTIHSVETAGFRPKQRPEYQADFDFGKAFKPLNLLPSSCPSMLPDAPLKNHTYKCSASSDRTIEALMVDTGEGQQAHADLLPIALKYFITRFVAKKNHLPDSENLQTKESH